VIDVHRRYVLLRIAAVSLAALAGCSEENVVVGPHRTGGRKSSKNREEDEVRSSRRPSGKKK
jgi:hypothetical protein